MINRVVVQSVECYIWDVEVACSSHVYPTFNGAMVKLASRYICILEFRYRTPVAPQINYIRNLNIICNIVFLKTSSNHIRHYIYV